MPFSRGSSQLRDRTTVCYTFCIGRQVLYHQHHLGSPDSLINIHKTISTNMVQNSSNVFLHCKYLCAVFSCSVMSNSLRPRGLQPTRLLCPWNFPGKNTGACCHFLLQKIFPTQVLKPHLLCLALAGRFFPTGTIWYLFVKCY